MALPNGTSYAEGLNYRIEIANRLVVCRLWRKEELSNQQWANSAERIVDLFQRLSELPTTMVRGAVIDVRETSRAWGPVFGVSLSRCVMAFERAGRRVAFLTSHDPEQRLSALQVVRERTSTASLFTDEYSAERWVVPEE